MRPDLRLPRDLKNITNPHAVVKFKQLCVCVYVYEYAYVYVYVYVYV